MVPLKLSIEDSFYEQEERNGFVVSPDMKKVWAVELDLLNEFARICNTHHLKWFAHAGTMLGAVRHHGFIPWDDDIDVVMPRSDYEALCNIGPQEFLEPYFFQNDKTDPLFCRSYSRLRNSWTTAFQIQERGLNVPYNQGIFIDIFPYDNLSDDEEEMKEEMKRMELLVFISKYYRNLVHFYEPPKESGFNKRFRHYLKHMWFKYVNRAKGDYLYYINEHNSIATRHNGQETCRVGEVIIPPIGRHIWNKEWLENAQMMPFEMISIPVPINYEDCLNVSFGKDWQAPKQYGNYHGQIIFDVDHPYTDFLKKH